MSLGSGQSDGLSCGCISGVLDRTYASTALQGAQSMVDSVAWVHAVRRYGPRSNAEKHLRHQGSVSSTPGGHFQYLAYCVNQQCNALSQEPKPGCVISPIALCPSIDTAYRRDFLREVDSTTDAFFKEETVRSQERAIAAILNPHTRG